MRYAVTLEGETLTKLVDRLFCPETPAGQRLVRARLKEANPGLPDRKQIAAGTIIVVPEVEGYEPKETRTEVQVAAALLDGLRKQLGDLPAELDRLIDTGDVEPQTTAELAKSRQVRTLVSRYPELEEQLAQASQAATDELKQSAELRRQQKKAIAEMQSDLDGMLESLGKLV